MTTRHTKLRLVVPMLLVPLLTFAQTASIPPQPLTVDGATAHVYKSIGGHQLRLHVFTLGNSGPAVRKPAIVFFFGGAWTNGTVMQFVPQATHMARRGVVAIVADYRVFNRHGTGAFEAIADAKSALRWVRAHAAQLGVDPDRIAAAGGSAGGHIAVSAAVFGTFDEAGEDKTVSSKPNALVLFNPAVDTVQSAHSAVRDRFGARGRDGSPVHHVAAGLPPTLILHGKADTTVPYADVERYCTEARKFGNQCQLVGYEGARHGFFNSDASAEKWRSETLLEADRFLTRLGYLPEPDDRISTALTGITPGVRKDPARRARKPPAL
jgi:acetyl esterase